MTQIPVPGKSPTAQRIVATAESYSSTQGQRGLMLFGAWIRMLWKGLGWNIKELLTQSGLANLAGKPLKLSAFLPSENHRVRSVIANEIRDWPTFYFPTFFF